MVPTIAVSGLFKDVDGYTHRLETLKLQRYTSDDNTMFRGEWIESDIHYILELEPTSDIEARMYINMHLE